MDHIQGQGLYGNKKSWVLVCKLISPFHDVEIADAGDDKSSIREAYVINEVFFKNVQASPSASRHAL